MTEKIVENQILSYLNKIGIFAFKNQSTGIFDPTKKVFRKSNNPFHINGVSDILAIMPDGRFLAIEVKRPYLSTKTGSIKHRTQEELSKMTSENQISFIKRVKDKNGVAFIADSVTIVEEQLELFKSLGFYHQAF